PIGIRQCLTSEWSRLRRGRQTARVSVGGCCQVVSSPAQSLPGGLRRRSVSTTYPSRHPSRNQYSGSVGGSGNHHSSGPTRLLTLPFREGAAGTSLTQVGPNAIELVCG